MNDDHAVFVKNFCRAALEGYANGEVPGADLPGIGLVACTLLRALDSRARDRIPYIAARVKVITTAE